ncbi:MAG: endonuclease/exonuclease/phosphatase family protein [Bacteroidota bacterium]
MSRKEKGNWLSKCLRLINILVVAALVCSYLSTLISPEKIPWLSFFGISFPIWMALNILFIALWLARRKAIIFLSLITLSLGYFHVSNFIQLSFSSSPEVKKNSFKVLSYNVKNFGLYSWKDNTEIRDSIMAKLDSIDADIMCFQEFYFSEREKGFQTKSILQEQFQGIQFHEKYTHELIHHQYFGVATASRFPILKKGYIEFFNDRNNFCIYSDLLIGLDTVRVFNGHFASIRFSNSDYEIMEKIKKDTWSVKKEEMSSILKRLKNASVKRASQIDEVMAEVAKSPFPVILAGDFNDTPTSYAYCEARKLLEDAFVEAGNGIGNTYNGAFPSFRIDYILHDESFKAHKFKTHQEKYSDHHAIQATLEMVKSLND